MHKQTELIYESPSAKTLEIKTRTVLCTSGDPGATPGLQEDNNPFQF